MLSSYNSPVAVGPTSPKLAASSAAATVTTTSVMANGVNDVAASHGTNGSSAHSRCSSCHHIWLVTGPAGCGKSTVAEHLANSLNLPYVEGDEFHPKANIDKMSNGIPLTDADRWDWLTALREESMRRISDGDGRNEVVLTCSALKRKYRDVIRVAPYFNTGVSLHFIYLSADPQVLLARVAGRKGHYMGANMVQSQLDILEPPQADETDVICFDVDRPLDEVKADVLQRVQSIINEDKA
ncbi:gluconokinase [Sporothrix schenckii 1099-18]|uniref:Gluconokinase n=1 Tax=Sporothrix schenckii 1099-18 TaxID=1397361 RepID=A0A0F2M3Z6_SPOSC|nr:gluconokinase [Sporothrix schenckii 1099-18]KJR84428.1 gluconokinase [Sporothrix schenckii 1099-18]